MICLIRHGKTQANLENRFAGRSAEPLCPEGIGQLQRMSEELKSQGFERLYCSPLPRTRQSAEIIGKVCSLAVETCEGLNEIFLPHWDGLTKDEIRQRFGSEYPTWLSQPDRFYVSGCESLLDVQKRTVASVKEIAALHGNRKILLVTHLIVARCLALFDRKLSLAKFRSIAIVNGDLVPLGGVLGGGLSG